MVEAGDTVSRTLKKEFGEEALNSIEATEQEKKEIEAHINQLFKTGDKVHTTITIVLCVAKQHARTLICILSAHLCALW